MQPLRWRVYTTGKGQLGHALQSLLGDMGETIDDDESMMRGIRRTTMRRILQWIITGFAAIEDCRLWSR